MNAKNFGRTRMAGLLGLAGLAAGLGGCDHSSVATLMGGKNGEAVTASDFAGSGEGTGNKSGTFVQPVRPVTDNGASPVWPTKNAPGRVVNIGGNAADGASVAGGGSPPARSTLTRQPEITTTVGSPSGPAVGSTPITIDAVVGQINGKPVLMSEILDPLDGTLRAAASSAKDIKTWQRAAAEPIVRELKRRIEDELIISEAKAGLTSDQKAGLLRFLGQIEASLISAQQGSEVKADEEARHTTGRSLKQEAEDQKDRALITNELRSRVVPRVTVSWRDVQNEYERQHEKFHPPAEYTFHMIYAAADKKENVAKIQEGLTGGPVFIERAGQDINEFNSREAGKMMRKVSGALGEAELFPAAEVNNALRSLSVGQMLGPIEYSPDKKKPDVKRLAWVYLERVDQPQGVSLYDAQLELENDLREERTSAEIQRYFERLRKRGNVSKIEVMADKLMAVATDRYAPRFNPK